MYGNNKREQKAHGALPKGAKNPLFCRNSKITTEVQKSPWEHVLVMRHKTTTHTLEGVEKSYAKTITLANTL